MAITYILDDLSVLGGDLVLGNTGPSPASGTPVKGTCTIQPAGNSTAGELILQSKTAGGVTRSFTVKASITQAADTAYTLPVNYPASNGYVLASTTAGVLSWSAAGGGSGTVGGTGTAKHLARWATGGTDIEDTNWDATSDVIAYDDATQKMSIDPTPGTITIQHPNGGATYILLAAEYSDAQARFELSATGLIGWGPGGIVSRDIQMFRGAAKRLDVSSPGATGTALRVWSDTTNFSQIGSKVRSVQTADTDIAIDTLISTDTNARLTIDANGQHAWGAGGVSAADLVLSRLAANLLGLAAGDAFCVQGGGSDHASTTDGTLYYRTDLDQMRLMANGAWVSLAQADANADITALSGLTGAISQPTQLLMANGGTIDSATGVANTLLIQGYATTGGTRIPVITITNGALIPLMDFLASATIGGAYIYRVGGTDVAVADGGTGASTAGGARNNLAVGSYSTALTPIYSKQHDTSQLSSVGNDTGYVSYYGKAPNYIASGGTVHVGIQITTAWVTAGTTPWCEVAILKGTPVFNTNPVLTVIGTVAIPTASATGTYDASVVLTADINAGDDLWVGTGSKATTTRMVCRGVPGLSGINTGLMASKTSMGAFSALAVNTTFTSDNSLSAAAGYMFIP